MGRFAVERGESLCKGSWPCAEMVCLVHPSRKSHELCPSLRACGGDAASVIFNLPGYRVVDAVDLPLGGRRVRVQPVDLADGCPSCGVISARVHAWIVQRVRDIPHAGQLEVMVRKPRLVCA